MRAYQEGICPQFIRVLYEEGDKARQLTWDSYSARLPELMALLVVAFSLSKMFILGIGVVLPAYVWWCWEQAGRVSEAVCGVERPDVLGSWSSAERSKRVDVPLEKYMGL